MTLCFILDAGGDSAGKAAGRDWQERALVRSGGTLTARFPSPLDDAHFDILLKELNVTQQPETTEK